LSTVDKLAVEAVPNTAASPGLAEGPPDGVQLPAVVHKLSLAPVHTSTLFTTSCKLPEPSICKDAAPTVPLP